MMLPYAADAIVPREKLVGCLLSRTHPDGAGKAEFFERHGFSAERWEELREALLAHAVRHQAAGSGASEFRVRYTVDGALRRPDGRDPLVRSVWFIEAGERTPRQVTAYPLRRKEP